MLFKWKSSKNKRQKLLKVIGNLQEKIYSQYSMP